MNFRTLALIYFLGMAIGTSAQAPSVTTKEIRWTGFDTWTTPLSAKQVIAFAGARYPANDELPYFVEEVEKTPNTTLSFHVENAVFQPVTTQEELMLNDKNLPEELTVIQRISRSRGTEYAQVQILPFVKQAGKIMKLVAFDLHTTQLRSLQKAPSPTRHTYAEESVLKSGRFVKIKIRETGIYKLTYEALRDMGVDPANVRIFGYGGALINQNFTLTKPDDLPEVAVWTEKGADGIFNAGDYILFFGQGIVQWNYNSDSRLFTHTLNHYATDGYYFVTSDAGQGKQIQEKNTVVPTDASIVDVDEFADYQLHEVEQINIGQMGKVFYGEEFSLGTTLSFPFSFPNLTGSRMTTIVDVAANASESTSFEMQMNTSSKRIYVSKTSDKYERFRTSLSYDYATPPTDANFSVNLTYKGNNTDSKGYLNYIAVNARRKLHMTGSTMFFRNVDNLNSGKYSRFRMVGANDNIRIWDITDPANVERVSTTNNSGMLEFMASNDGVRQYVALDPTNKDHFPLEPTVVGVVPNQNLHALPQADMVIITHPDFTAQAERLAAAHLEKDNLSTHVVTTEQVYNEFSSGTPDASAYRWLMKMFYDRAMATGTLEASPKYLLLFGRGSYDNRGIIKHSGDNKILTYQADRSEHQIYSYVTDDYFGFLDDEEGTNATIPEDKVDLGIGRFPVATPQQANDVVNKIIAYMNNEIKGNWKNQLAFLAEDGDSGLHIKQAENLAKILENQVPRYQLNKIYLDAFQQEVTASGESYPLARKKLHDLLRSGLLMLNYTGHANLNGWTSELVLTAHDVRTMYNTKLPLWIGATCQFLLFDTKEISAGEYVLLNPNGGGIALFSAARVVFAHNNEQLNRYFTGKLFDSTDGRYPRLGDAFRYAKNSISTSELNKLSFILLGDPALRLNYPADYNVVTTKINGSDAQLADTLKALSINTIEGRIENNKGELASEFNGTVEVSIYDKKLHLKTLLNSSATSTEVNEAVPYTDRPNILYAGKVHAVDGLFSFSFMMPKDIRYNYGAGRLSYYAADTESGNEGHGYFENFIVGGSSNNTFSDTEGPEIALYLNTPTFQSGDKVNETPMLYARLADNSGINTAGIGIGHDLRIVINDSPELAYTMNEYFEADVNSYTSGMVQMKLPEMSNGKHTLTLYAWDLLNNSSQRTIDFEVVNGLVPTIFDISSYPNPMTTSATFVIAHDRPETILEARIDIFDLTGRLIFTQTQNATDRLTWDAQDTWGHRVRPGMYLYNVSVKTANSQFSSKANKIIVLEQ